MNLENLKYFYEVANSKSISKAAAKSHMSQSAISRQIQRLEESMDAKLILRSNKGVELTSAGKLVLEYTEKILHNIDMMEAAVQNFNVKNNEMKISICCVLNPFIMSKVVYLLKRKYKKLNFNMSSNFCDKIEADISNQSSQVGLVCKMPSDGDVLYEKLSTDRIILASSTDFNIPDMIEFKDILDYPFLHVNVNNSANEIIRNKLENIGKSFSDLKEVFKSDSTEAVKASVLNGQGITFMPYLVLQQELEKGVIKEIAVADLELEYDIYLIYGKNIDENTRLVANELKTSWLNTIQYELK